MTIPKISLACLSATLEKATQTEPDHFAIQTMNELACDQPDLMSAVQHLVSMFIGEDDEPEEDESDATVPAGFAKEMIVMSSFCVLGVVMKALDATLEAVELEELYGSEESDEDYN
jgi:hypothetical protein